MMKNKKRYLYLNDDETRLVLQSLIRFKNKLQQQGRYTDCVPSAMEPSLVRGQW